MNITQEDNLLVQSYMTISFLLELKNLDFLNSSYYKEAEFQDKYVKENLPTIGIDNQGSMLLALYAMLVIPHSTSIKDRFTDEFDKINNVVHMIKNDAKTESNYKSDSKVINYIRHIRNSVAHARVSFVPNTEVVFSDSTYNRKTEKNETCTITIPLADFGVFMTALQKLFFEYVKTANQNSSS